MRKTARFATISGKRRISSDPLYRKADKPNLKQKKLSHWIIITWAAYLFAGIVLILWIGNESRQVLASYQQSPMCATAIVSASPQNCRMIVQVRIYDKWISNTPGRGAKGGGVWEKMNFVVGFPDGTRKVVSVPINNHGASKKGELTSYALNRIPSIEQGTITQAEYWEGRVTNVTIPIPNLPGNLSTETTQLTYITVDHPLNAFDVNLSKAVSLLIMIFFALTLWTAFLLLRQ